METSTQKFYKEQIAEYYKKDNMEEKQVNSILNRFNHPDGNDHPTQQDLD